MDDPNLIEGRWLVVGEDAPPAPPPPPVSFWRDEFPALLGLAAAIIVVALIRLAFAPRHAPEPGGGGSSPQPAPGE